MEKENSIIQYYIQRLYDKGLTTMSGGNLSIKSPSGIFVTPSEIDKGTLTPEDIMCEKPNGEIVGKHTVTSEYPAHKAIYCCNPDKNAVLHSHASSILGFSTARILPNIKLLASTFKEFNGKISMAKYAEPGTDSLAIETSKALNGQNDVAILENHGIFIVGNTMETCYDKLEDMDLLAKIQSNIYRLGGDYVELTAEEQKAINEFVPPELAPSQSEMSGDYKAEKELLIALLKRAYKRHMSTCKNCCMSIRMASSDILVNPDNIDVMKLTVADIVVVREHQYIGANKPHQDFYTHLPVYDNYPTLNSVITSRPPYTMAYATSHYKYSSPVVPECYGYLRDIDKLDMVQGEALCKALSTYFNSFNVSALIKNQMYIVAAEYALKAYDRLEVAESTAEALINTRPIKAPIEMDPEAIEQMNRKCGISRNK